MKHLFTLFAGISLLICLSFIVVTAISFATEVQVRLGQSDQRIYSFQAVFGDMRLNGWLSNFGRNNLTITDNGGAGINWQKQTRPADSRDGLPPASGFSIAVNAAYLIILFAILPVIWAVQAFRRRKADPAHAEQTAPPKNRPYTVRNTR